MPPSALVSEEERERVDINRDFPVTQHGDRRSDVKADDAKVLVLSTPEDTRDDALNCGEALSTVLLECTMAGLATCTLTHITEIHACRERIRTLTGNIAEPQVLVRVGSVPKTSRPRPHAAAPAI